MRVLIQRVSQAKVTVAAQTVGEINSGLLLLVGVGHDDNEADITWLVNKICNLRLFSDEKGVMNCSLLDVGGEALAVSQFTLFAQVKKGNRPSWGDAAPGPISQPLFDEFVRQLSFKLNKPVPTGQFGADMQVSLTNDGPVTVFIDSKD
ncbi:MULTISPECIES: D-aminoacyl-tRNA deacylase [Deefgea]|uniref:D-aminoacyl-tRNA deacylase n=1 Tax=Deefgea chitinilytica TaxID=570276 RepID=A0ABS2C7D8_9NEIS|nr:MULTISPECIES: D-aminoacyl-tRNA deacylase [Deefgea]MBM5570065.1 D-tyrosyl-tRNA(Tyr) deacylase [Deefgea chitinilytica]MBM9887294.1 D-tyrosyl-tRNA(Tyr) deacylase [Deefgea sp. CFH1-16]